MTTKQAPGDAGETAKLDAEAPPAYGATGLDLEAPKAAKTGVPLSERAIGHPEVHDIDAIPYEQRKKYLKDGVPTVGVAVKIISIASLNMAEDTFLADFNLNVCWTGGKDDHPLVQFYNLVEEIAKDEAEPKTGTHDGTTQWDWFYRIRIRGVFRQVYKLEYFPFDTQMLTIDVRLKKVCKLTPVCWGFNGEACSCDPRAVNDEFILSGAEVKHKYLPSYKFGHIDGYDPEATLIFEVVRKPMFWVVSYGVVASLVASLMACTYAIPVRWVGERLGVAMTLVLTMTATKYLMQEKLPSVSYFTLLDIHIVLCCLFLMVLTAEIGFTHVVGSQQLEKLEHEFLPVVAVAWIGYHVLVALWMALQ